MIWSVVVFHAVADELPQGGAECSPMGLKSAAEIRKKQEVEKKKNKQARWAQLFVNSRSEY